MKKKLVLWNTLIVVIALLLMFGLGIAVTRDNNYAQAKERIVELTKAYASNYSPTGDYTKKLDGNIRLTIIDATGIVISDSEMSELSTIENHISRDEIIAALNDKPQSIIRYSSTVGKNMIYYAEKVQTGSTYVFVRVATPVESINMYVAKTIPLMLGILIASLVVSFFAGLFLNGELLKPLKNVKKNLQRVSEGTYTTIVPATDDADVNQIISDINAINENLQKNIADSRDDRQKLNYIINNVTDGIIVFDSDGNIVLLNANAKEIFGLTEAIGKSVFALTSDKKICDGVSYCVNDKKSSIFETTIGERVLLCAVKYTDSGLIITVLSDISAARNNEKIRSEFFANASHELKTPLTTIIGFNEMIAIKSNDNTIKSFSEKITGESVRMLTLIDDMLNLSKLEASAELNKTEVNARAVADDVVDSLSTISRKKNVSVNISGNGTIFAEKEHVFELIKNLVENAIRYNNDGGKVDITLRDCEKYTVLTVSDNGIGIDDEHRSRIFERFYRVDKSRSRETGGTGLGLSIVKHIAELYNADLKLTSKLGVGTEITIVFPSNPSDRK